MKTQTKTGSQILDDRHLEIRARILELIAWTAAEEPPMILAWP